MALHSRRTKVTLLGFAVAITVAIMWFAEHIHWAITGPKGITGVPTSPLVVNDLPPGYLDCSVGSMTINIPPFLGKATAVNGRVVLFEENRAKLAVFLPQANSEAVLTAWKEVTGRLPQRFRCSRHRACAAIYAASSGDFHWGMSRSELRWHKWKMRERWIVGLFPVESVETLFRRDIEATLLWMANRKSAFLNWEATNGLAAGVISFSQEGNLNRLWVRRVCDSLTFSGTCYSLPMTDDEIMAMTRVEEP